MQEFLSELGEQSDIADLTYIRKQQQKALFDHQQAEQAKLVDEPQIDAPMQDS